MLDELRAHAPSEIVGEAVALNKEYADIFALTLTLVNSPRKTIALIQMMRDRSSSGCAARSTVFQGEEEGYLDKMSAVSVIQTSTSD